MVCKSQRLQWVRGRASRDWAESGPRGVDWQGRGLDGNVRGAAGGWRRGRVAVVNLVNAARRGQLSLAQVLCDCAVSSYSAACLI